MPGPEVVEVIRLLWLTFGVVVGACLGSFANVIIWRVPRGQSIVSPRSRCPACGTAIPAWDNLPVASWLVLRGRARCCGARISPRYVVVELVCAVLGLWVVAHDGPGLAAVMHGLMLLMLLCAALIDLDDMTIPRGLSLGLIPLGVLGNTAVALARGASLQQSLLHEAVPSILGAVVGYGVLALVILAFTPLFRALGRIEPDQEVMGWGDAHLLAGIGACLGPGALIWVLTLASAQGSVMGALMLAAQRRGEGKQPSATGSPPEAHASTAPGDSSTSEAEPLEDDWVPPRGAVPFGPFLALSAAEILFFGYLLPDFRLDLWGG